MDSIETRRIGAVIPDTQQPPQYVANLDGTMPSLEHSMDSGCTFEGTLTRIGHLATGKALSVDKFIGTASSNTLIYQAKAIPTNVELSDEYKWSTTRPTI